MHNMWCDFFICTLMTFITSLSYSNHCLHASLDPWMLSFEVQHFMPNLNSQDPLPLSSALTQVGAFLWYVCHINHHFQHVRVKWKLTITSLQSAPVLTCYTVSSLALNGSTGVGEWRTPSYKCYFCPTTSLSIISSEAHELTLHFASNGFYRVCIGEL